MEIFKRFVIPSIVHRHIANLLSSIQKYELASAEYLKLIDENPDNVQYLQLLLTINQAMGKKADEILQMFRYKCSINFIFFRDLSKKYPKSHLLYRFPLNFVDGDIFVDLLKSYLKKMFRKGVPSLFNSFKDLFSKKEKSIVIQKVVADFYTSLLNNGTFGDVEEGKETPTALLWVLYFLGNLYDRTGQIDKALECINAAIEHSPTVVELYMTKARIFKVNQK